MSIVAEFENVDYWEVPPDIQKWYYPKEIVSQLKIVKNTGTLANWRVTGKNLTYRKDNGEVAYPYYGKKSLSAYLKRKAQCSTSDNTDFAISGEIASWRERKRTRESQNHL